MIQYSWMSLRILQVWLASVYSASHYCVNLVVRVPSHALVYLDRWTSPINVCVDIACAHPQLTLTLATDTSDLGRGAHLGFLHLQIQRLWLAADLALYLNVRELKAIKLVYQVFLLQIQGKSHLVLIDNTRVMIFLSGLGGT